MIKQQEYRGLLYVAIAGLCWSFVVIALKLSSVSVAPLTVVWFRFTLSFILLSVWFLIKDPAKFKILLHPPLLLIAGTIALMVNYICIVLGVIYTTPNTTQVFITLGPVFFALSGFIVFKEKINRYQAIGFVVSLSGMALFYERQLNLLMKDTRTFNLGILFTIIAALGWTVYAVIQKKLVKRYDTQQMNLVIYGLPSLVLIPFVHFGTFTNLPNIGWALLLFLGLNTLVSYGFISAGIKYVEANVASIILCLNPIITFASMALINYLDVKNIDQENFSILTLLGAALVITGAILVIRFAKRNREV